MMGCLDENTVVELVEGRLSEEARQAVQGHLATCGACRRLVAQTAEALLPTAASGGASLDLSLAPLRGLRAGDMIGRYRVLHRVGAGAMGVVYAADDTALRRRVALKVLRSESGQGLEARLLREARAASVIRHPNIVPVHDVLELDDGSPVLVMDLLVGEPLRERLERERQLSLDTTRTILLSVVSALEAAHALGVVHRDLKPDNIFLSITDAGTLDVKIVDFGVAKLTALEGPAARSAGLTDTGALVGTPFYMAPEQAFGESDLDPRADLFAVGVIFFECLTGVRPTEASNVGQVLKRLAHLDFPNIRTVKPDVPEPVAKLIEELMCDRDKRVPSASELRRRLEELDIAVSRSMSTLQGASITRSTGGTRGIAAIVGVALTVLAGVGVGVSVWVGRGHAPSASSDGAPAVSAPASAVPATVPTAPPVVSSSATSWSPLPPRNTKQPKPSPSPSQSAPSPSDSPPGPPGLLTDPPF